MRQRFAIICKAGEVFFGELDADRALSRVVGWLKLRRDLRTSAEPERVDSEMAFGDLSGLRERPGGFGTQPERSRCNG